MELVVPPVEERDHPHPPTFLPPHLVQDVLVGLIEDVQVPTYPLQVEDVGVEGGAAVAAVVVVDSPLPRVKSSSQLQLPKAMHPILPMHRHFELPPLLLHLLMPHREF